MILSGLEGRLLQDPARESRFTDHLTRIHSDEVKLDLTLEGKQSHVELLELLHVTWCRVELLQTKYEAVKLPQHLGTGELVGLLAFETLLHLLDHTLGTRQHVALLDVPDPLEHLLSQEVLPQ